MKKAILVIILLSIYIGKIYPQSAADAVSQYPSSASQLGISDNQMKPPSGAGFSVQTGDVDFYTGKASFTIPIYDLKSRALSLPISLHYSSAGTLVGEIAGWTGMDWNLSAGGSITRELHGFPDEMPDKGYFYHGEKAQNFTSKTQSEKKEIVERAQDKDYDTEPDVFYYSFGGGSGKFVIDNDQEIVFMPYRNWKVNKTITDERLTAFEIITDNGTKYKFGQNLEAIEEIKTTTLKADLYHEFINSDYDMKINLENIEEKSTFEGFYTSAWHLIKIESITDAINLNYSDLGEITYVDAPQILNYAILSNFVPLDYGPFKVNYIFRTVFDYYMNLKYDYSDEEGSFNVKCTPSFCYDNLPMADVHEESLIRNPSSYFVHQTLIQKKIKVLSSITTQTGSLVEFIITTSRQDLAGMPKLEEINIYDQNRNNIKGYKFNYETIVSESIDETGQKIDPLAIIELEAAKDLDIEKIDGNGIPASRLHNYFDEISVIKKDLIEKYVFEGLKHYNYKRLYLKSVQEYNKTLIIPPYEFSYINPERILRRTTMWVDNYGYSLDIQPGIFYDKYQATYGLNKPAGNSYGQL